MAIAFIHNKKLGASIVKISPTTFNLRRPPDIEYIDTDVTANFSLKEYIAPDGNSYATRCGKVTAGQEYVIICIPVNPDNLWENFLFENEDGSAVEGDDIGQYVEKVCDMMYTKMYTITIPDNCETLHINHTKVNYFKIHLINKEET